MTHRYAPRANPHKGTPTKDEHDEWVAEHGRPFTDLWFPWWGLKRPRPAELDNE